MESSVVECAEAGDFACGCRAGEARTEHARAQQSVRGERAARIMRQALFMRLRRTA